MCDSRESETKSKKVKNMVDNPEQTPETALEGELGSDVDGKKKESQAARYKKQRDAANFAFQNQQREVQDLRGAVDRLTELVQAQQNPTPPRRLEDYPEHELYKSAMDGEMWSENPLGAARAMDAYQGKRIESAADKAKREAIEEIQTAGMKQSRLQAVAINLQEVYGADAVTTDSELYQAAMREAEDLNRRYYGGKLSLEEHPEAFEAATHRAARKIGYKSPEDIEKERQLQARKRLDSPVESPEVGDGTGEGPTALEKAMKAGDQKSAWRERAKLMGF
jgi:hypothetical protein